MRGFLVGSLALIALEAFIRRADQAGALLTGVASVVERAISPEVGGVPNLVARRRAAGVAASSPAPSSPARNTTVVPFVPAGSVPTGSAGLSNVT